MRKFISRWAKLALLCGAGLVPSLYALRPAPASVLTKLSLGEMAGRADRALVGTVEEVRSRFLGDGGYIVTEVRIRCTRELLGVPQGTVFTVTHLGGEVGEIGQKVFGEASYQVGQEVLLLAEERVGAFFAVGMAQGALHIEREPHSGERRVRVELAGAELQGPSPANAASAEPTANGASLDAVLAQLQPLLAAKAAQRARPVSPSTVPAPTKGGK
ncbi:MAG TPA: hypothetical protein PLW65_11095 [Pseudomonadota bacterium]|nr:hypothetical protein [Pseudomonadota bacterium]